MRLLGDSLFTTFETITYKLTIVSLVLFPLGIILPSIFFALHDLLSAFPSIFQYDDHTWQGYVKDSLFIYGFKLGRLSQNHGFMWEPTAFASVLILAIIFRLSRNGYQFDRRIIVMFVGLVSTFSTTGYIILFTILPCLLFLNRTFSKMTLFAIYMTPLLGILFFSQSFLYEKIANEFERGDIQYETSELSRSGNSRLSSFLIDMRDVADNPILGLGIFEEGRLLGHQTRTSVNDISDTIARFGLVGSLLIFALYAISLTRFYREQNAKGGILVFISFLLMCWSEEFLNLPLFMAFQFYCFTPYSITHRK